MLPEDRWSATRWIIVSIDFCRFIPMALEKDGGKFEAEVDSVNLIGERSPKVIPQIGQFPG